MVVLSNKSAHADQALVFTDHKNYLSQSIATPEEGLYFLQKHFPVCGDISSRNHRKHITILKKNLNTLNDSLSQPVPLEFVTENFWGIPVSEKNPSSILEYIEVV